jgi:hypothetical protein
MDSVRTISGCRVSLQGKLPDVGIIGVMEDIAPQLVGGNDMVVIVGLHDRFGNFGDMQLPILSDFLAFLHDAPDQVFMMFEPVYDLLDEMFFTWM